ncbi:transcription initiation factor TFIID subunit 3 [Apophysomyces sp. BC1015]|nr:transcription initiation factor TFIID subunit 3 [Apophysomyces sp. BC1015]
MADNFCFALLRTTTLQILQSAGFESVHVDPTDILTDVFCQYIQLLASTTSAYAQLSGRTTGNIRDVMDGLAELAVDPESLREWLEEEGKALTPTWTTESDPGRILEGIVKSGRTQHDDVFVYEYKDIPQDALSDDDIYILDEEDEEVDNSDYDEDPGRSISPIPDDTSRENNALPDYVPSYLPPFPSTVKDETEPDAQNLPSSSLPLPISHPSSNSAILPPVIVKTRKKPIDNPFMHITPFEESSLAAEKDTSLALSVAVRRDENYVRPKPATASKRRKVLTNLPMKEFLDTLNQKDQAPRKVREELSGNANIFRNFTQDEAAPGNNMFGHTAGVLGEIVRHVAQPVAVAKLSSPNLLVDVAAAAAVATTPTNSVATVTTPTATNGQPSSQEPPQSKPNGTSMLATLAGGQSARKQSLGAVPTSATTSAQTATPLFLSSTTPPTTKGAPSTPTASKPPLAPISLASLSATSASKVVKKKKIPKLTLNLANGDTSTQAGPSSTASTPYSATTPLSTPKIRFKIKPPEPSETPARAELPPAPSLPLPIQGSEGEVIRCVCENPTVDYGTFMIACDTCSVWFHGSCVGIAESDQVEEWHCQRCRR